jgi:hypothetical protein
MIRIRATSSRSIGIYVRKVSWIELRGERTDNGQPIVERIRP